MSTLAAACPHTADISALRWIGIIITFAGWAILFQLTNARLNNENRWLRWIGQLLRKIVAWLCLIAAVVLNLAAGHDSCGRLTGWQSTASVWFFVAGIGCFAHGAKLAKQRTGWLASAALALGDFGILIFLLADKHLADRSAIIVIFCVHGTCSAIASRWACQLRHASPALYGKATEPGRNLAIAWLAVVLLFIASASNKSLNLLDNTTLFGLLVVGSLNTVFGTGRTTYSDALTAHRQATTHPDQEPSGQLEYPARTATRSPPNWPWLGAAFLLIGLRLVRSRAPRT